MPGTLSKAATIVKDVRDGLRLTLTIGAALEDATPTQEEKIKAVVRALVPDYQETGEAEQIITAIHEIMGTGWRPVDDWAAYLEVAEKISV